MPSQRCDRERGVVADVGRGKEDYSLGRAWENSPPFERYDLGPRPMPTQHGFGLESFLLGAALGVAGAYLYKAWQRSQPKRV